MCASDDIDSDHCGWKGLGQRATRRSSGRFSPSEDDLSLRLFVSPLCPSQPVRSAGMLLRRVPVSGEDSAWIEERKRWEGGKGKRLLACRPRSSRLTGPPFYRPLPSPPPPFFSFPTLTLPLTIASDAFDLPTSRSSGRSTSPPLLSPRWRDLDLTNSHPHTSAAAQHPTQVRLRRRRGVNLFAFERTKGWNRVMLRGRID